MNNRKLNYGEAHLYLRLLNGNKPIDDVKWQFTFFDERGGGMKGGRYDTLENAWPEIEKKNHMGCGVFITANKTDKPARNGKSKNDDITAIRAVWRDIDKSPTKDPNLTSTMTVTTSRDKWHDYWVVDGEDVDFQEWEIVMQTMVSEFGADKSAIDLSRVLRLPGTYHQKSNPVMVTLKTSRKKKPYKWSEILKAISPTVNAILADELENKNNQPILLEDIEEMLEVIPCDELEEKEWWNITVSVRHCVEAIDDVNLAYEIWDKWSKGGKNYNEKENLKQWKNINGKYTDITAGTLIHYAKKYGWNELKKRRLVERYIYCQDRTGSYYDITTGMILTKDVFNETNLLDYPGGKGSPKANVVYQKDINKRIVHGYGWLPLPYGEEKELIFEDNGKQYINEWRGFAIDPIKGDISLWLELVEFLIPDKNEREAILDWMAFTVQKPQIKLNYQILHMGQEGVGKDVMYSPLAIIFGESAEDIDQGKAASEFEDGWSRKKFVTIQEVYKPDNKNFINILKTKAASTTTGMSRMNIKMQQQVLQPNLVSFVAMSNHEDCINLSITERRYFVVKSFFPPKEDFDYAYLADKWMRQEGGASHIFHYLLHRNLSKFDHGILPFRTEAFYELAQSSRPEYEVMIEDLDEKNEDVFADELLSVEAVRKMLPEHKKNVAGRSIAKALNNIGWEKLKNRGQKKVDGKVIKTPYLYSKDPKKYNKLTPVKLWNAWEKIRPGRGLKSRY